MKLVALYKTWDGGEFVDASLASIYDHVDSIVMVHSEVSWLGQHGNTVRPLALEWCQQHDKSGKVHHVDVELSSQEAQYAAGVDYIRHYDLGDVTMVVDADEVWDANSIENAKQQIRDRPFSAYRGNMHTYLKTPFYQVDPPFGSPTVFLTHPELLTQSPRGSRSPARQLSDVWMHHYTYVRETRADVARKLNQSCHADGNEKVIAGWMESVYDKLPEGQNLHAFQRHRRVWQRIKKLWISEIPKAMRTAQLMKLWWPDDRIFRGSEPTEWASMNAGEKDALYCLAKGREQAVDLGTYRGVSAVVLALACRRVHTVDFYERGVDDQYSEYAIIGGHSLSNTQAICERFGNMTCEASDTAEAASRWNMPVDVLFVDADHSESGTLTNVEAWLPHLRAGGRIIFHDDNDIHPGVQAALNRLRGDSRFRFFSPGEHAGSLAVCEVVK